PDQGAPPDRTPARRPSPAPLWLGDRETKRAGHPSSGGPRPSIRIRGPAGRRSSMPDSRAPATWSYSVAGARWSSHRAPRRALEYAPVPTKKNHLPNRSQTADRQRQSSAGDYRSSAGDRVGPVVPALALARAAPTTNMPRRARPDREELARGESHRPDWNVRPLDHESEH